jgi:formylglycine-generating enzyme required for sulfatase activity
MTFRLRGSLAGYETVETAFSESAGSWNVTLQPAESAPPGMVTVRGGKYSFSPLTSAQVADYWIDKHEVTHKRYKEFVEAGGYQKREFWKEPFVHDGRPVFWEEAMAQFRDKTGRPGPSTWEFGTYPEGSAEYPVGGISWYEAVAYANFAGRSLPTVFHWYGAAGGGNPSSVSDIFKTSNFGANGSFRRWKGPGIVGHLRHGGQRPGVVLERGLKWQQVPPWWCLE